jgi:site-specific recombinase XerC
MPTRTKKHVVRKIVLRLPDLDHAKTSVLNGLSSPRSRRNYKFAMEQFITWYCSEPRLALNRTVVLRFRLHLESLGLAAGTINQRLAAVRRLAYEAADSGLLSPELAAGIRRVKGVKQLGCRAGNWLNREQARLLLEKSNGEGLRSIRDVAMISILLGCGLRRAELSALRREDIQIRQGHWAIVDLIGKGNHVRTVPMPIWVKQAVDRWLPESKRIGDHATPLENAVDTLLNQTIADKGTVFAIGSAYADSGQVDGIHDIHMNQGNPIGTFGKDNGIWQDGAIFIYLPATGSWTAIFIAFQTESWNTDSSGNPLSNA